MEEIMKHTIMALGLAVMFLTTSCGTYEGHQYDRIYKTALPESFEGWEIDLSENTYDLRISRSKETQLPVMGVWGYDGYNLTEQSWGFTLHHLLAQHYFDRPIYLENAPGLPRMDFYYETKYPEKGASDDDMAKKELAENLRPLLSRIFDYSTEVKSIPLRVTTISVGDRRKVESIRLPDDIYEEEILKGNWQLSDFLNLIESYADEKGYHPDNPVNALNKTANRTNELFVDETAMDWASFPIPVEAYGDVEILKQQLRDWGFTLTEKVEEREALVITFNE